ncbi:MbtH-like protein [Burkholderia multivorans CF2]|nr:MbtH domain protein [Burkholderia multivorans CGD1]EJO58257.1 MbtH-like protein [Burkholderia multivorans CF2]
MRGPFVFDTGAAASPLRTFNRLKRFPIMTQATTPSADSDDLVYTVVINDEEQYSIWPTFRPVPAGWREVGVRGAKADCLAHIETVWTDMRPASLRRAMDGERAPNAS